MLRVAVPPGFLLADAPWDVRTFHREFPFDEFGAGLDFRTPQVYWVAHKVNVWRSFERYIDSWGTDGHLPSGSIWGTATVPEVAAFELQAHAAGMRGVLYWVHGDTVPQPIQDWFAAHPWY